MVFSVIEKISDYNPVHDSEAKARDYKVFSYLCNGINIKDVARLMYMHLSRKSITFIRAKTERTSQHDLNQIVAIRPRDQPDAKRWGNRPASANTCVFPIFIEGITPVSGNCFDGSGLSDGNPTNGALSFTTGRQGIIFIISIPSYLLL